MKKIFKKIDKKHLAVFLPLTLASYVFAGITPMFIIAFATGLIYIAWQATDNA